MENFVKKRACIIGAGPRGLVVARHLSAVEGLEVQVFEAQDKVGGMWLRPNHENFDERNNYQELYGHRHGSIYETLTTNLPYFFMEYKDLGMLDVDRETPLILNMGHYQKYLDAYADKFGLKRSIQFNTVVKSVRLYDNLSEEEKEKVQTPRKFVVKTVESRAENIEENICTEEFDYVVVASGQNSTPYTPKINGIEKFTGNVIHAKDFRTPNAEMFQEKRILVIGGGYSAVDMLIQFCSREVERKIECKKLILCSKSIGYIKNSRDFSGDLQSGKLAIYEGGVKGFKEGNIVCLSDGVEEEVDTIMYATGYKLKFPYLDKEVDRIIDQDEEEHRGCFFGPTYKKFIAIREPDMFFVGFLQQTSLIHILGELQALVIRYIIEGKLVLPSQEAMMKDFDAEVVEHLEKIGDLAHFYKANLADFYPNMTGNVEKNDWLFLSQWLKPIHKNNNEEKAQEFFNHILEAKKEITKLRKDCNLIQFKHYNYWHVFPKDFRNTSDFV